VNLSQKKEVCDVGKNHKMVKNYLNIASGIGKELVIKTFEMLWEEGYDAEAICGYIRAVANSHPKWSMIID